MKKRIVFMNVRNLYGGTLVMANLCKILEEKGYNAKTFFVPDYFLHKREYVWKDYKYWIKYTLTDIIRIWMKYFPSWFGPERFHHPKKGNFIPIELKRKWLPFYNKRNTIIVYPEMVYGNPLHGKNVVRWLLYHYKYKNDKNAYRKEDLFICYRDIFNDWDLNPKGYKVCTPYYDKSTYKQYNFGDRKGKCYILRKGHERKDLPDKFDGPVIHYGMTEKEIVKVLNEHLFCYSYDTQTFYTSIAAICGCIPIIVMEEGKTKEDYLGNRDSKPYGKAYGDSEKEIQWAISTRDQLLKSLDWTEMNNKEADKFIEIMKIKFC